MDSVCVWNLFCSTKHLYYSSHSANFSMTGLQVIVGEQVSCRLLILASHDSNIHNYCLSGQWNIFYVNNTHSVQELEEKSQWESASISRYTLSSVHKYFQQGLKLLVRTYTLLWHQVKSVEMQGEEWTLQCLASAGFTTSMLQCSHAQIKDMILKPLCVSTLFLLVGLYFTRLPQE